MEYTEKITLTDEGVRIVEARVFDGKEKYSEIAKAETTKDPVEDLTGGLDEDLTKELGIQSEFAAVNDSITIHSFTEIEIDVLGNDAYGEDDKITIVDVEGTTKGEVSISPDCKSILYTPLEGYIGKDTFTYTIQNSVDNTERTATVTVTIKANTPPVAENDTANTQKNKSVVIYVLENDTDTDGDNITIIGVGTSENATVEISEDEKSLTYIPNTNFYGKDTFTYTISDGKGGTDTATVTVTVSYVDYPPYTENLLEEYTTDEDTPLTINFDLLDDVTPAGNITAQIKSDKPSIIRSDKIIMTGIGGDGSITLVITPEENAFGDATITLKASDGFNVAEITFTVKVSAVNDPPVANNDSVTFTEDTQITFKVSDLLENDSDIEGDTLVFESFTQPEVGELTLDEETETFTYIPKENHDEGTSFTYKINDEKGGEDTATVTLVCIPVNDKPWISEIEDQVTNEDTPIAGIVFIIGDHETNASQLVISVGSSDKSVVSDNHITVMGEGTNRTLTIMPNSNAFGVTTISVTVSDGEFYVTETFQLTVNAVQDPPVAADDFAAINSGKSVYIHVLENDYDLDGDTITVVEGSVSTPEYGTAVLQEDGSILYTSDNDYVGFVTFTYTISDGHENEDTATVTVACNNNEHTPIISNIPTKMIAEDGTLGPIIFIVYDPVDLDKVEITVTSSDESLFASENIVITKMGEDNCTYTITANPKKDAYGTAVITLTATDSRGSSYSSNFTVIVYPVNDAPVAVADNITTPEDEAVTFNVIANDTDAENDLITLLEIGKPENGTLTYLGEDKFSYTPNKDWHGTESIQYTISDSHAAKATGTLTITVTPVNDAPVAQDDYYYNVKFDEPIVLSNVLANDYDVDGDSFSIVSVESDASFEGDKITIPADPGYTGSKTFTYTIKDTGGLESTATIYLTTNAASASDFYISPYEKTVDEDSAGFSIDLASYINNHSGLPLTLDLSEVVSSDRGTILVEGDIVYYTPNPDAYGTDVFSYHVIVGSETKTSTITINILPINDAPTISDVSDIEVDEDTPITNVEITLDDVDNNIDDLVFLFGSSNQSAIEDSEITMTREGNKITLAFDPAEHKNGLTTITLFATDGLASVEKTFDINIKPVNDPPTAENLTVTLLEDTTTYISLIENIVDPDIDDVHKVAITKKPEHGTVTLDNGIATYTPNPNYNGNDYFEYSITDLAGASITVRADIEVTPVYDPTEIIGLLPSVTSTMGTPRTVTFKVPNPDDATITVSAVSQNKNLVKDSGLSITQTGTEYELTITPEMNASGSSVIVITADDGTQTYTKILNFGIDTKTSWVVAKDDYYTILEDTQTEFSVVSNDERPEGDSLKVIRYTSPDHGKVRNNMDGTLTYTPNKDYFGEDSFTYTASDIYGNSDEATVYITITAVNDAPVANTDYATTEEDTSVDIDILKNDTDVEGDTITLVSWEQPANGTVTVSEAGIATYTPDENYYGTDSFTYIISDGALTDVGTVYITITGVNDPPTIVESDPTSWKWEMDENTHGTFNVIISDPETESKNLLVTFSSTEKGLIADNNIKLSGTGGKYTVNLTPTENKNGTLRITINIDDGENKTTQIVNVIVRPVNTPPKTQDYNISMNEKTTCTGQLTATDVETLPQDLVYTLDTDTTKGTLTFSENGSWSYTPNTGVWGGTDSFTFTVTDTGDGDDMTLLSDTGIVTITINPVNEPPVANDDADRTMSEDTSLDLTDLLDNDTDPDIGFEGDDLKITKVIGNNNGTVVISEDGKSITYTPNEHWYGEETLTYTITDKGGLTDTATVKIIVDNVNDLLIEITHNEATDEDVPRTFTIPKDKIDVDVLDGEHTLVITGVTDGADGKVEIVDATAGTIKYTQDEEHWFGTDTFTYSVKNDEGETATITVHMTVRSVNDLPVAKNDSVTTNEDTSITIDVLANDEDIETETKDLVLKSVTQGSNGAVTIVGNKAVYTPNPNYYGTDTFSYVVEDKDGGEASATVTVTIESVDDNPVANDDNIEIDEDSLEITIDVLANDFDGDLVMPEYGEVLEVISLSNGPSRGVAVNLGNAVKYTPDLNFHGTDQFDYTIQDKRGITATATVYITVKSINDLPVAKDDSVTTNEDTPITIDVLENDTDIETDTEDLVLKSVTQGSNGAVKIVENKAVYTPNLHFNGADSFTYIVEDEDGGVATATVTVSITPVNDLLIAVDHSEETDEDTPITFDIPKDEIDVDVLDGKHTLVITEVTQGEHGTVEITDDGKIKYTPNQDYNGEDTFTYTVYNGDPDDKPVTITVTMTVNPVDDRPVANDDQITTDEDKPISGTATASDVDSESLTFTAETKETSNGSVTINADGSYTYTPNENFNGTDSFEVTVSDGFLNDTATITVTVNPINDAPIADDKIVAVDEKITYTGKLTATDIETPTDELKFSVDTLPEKGTLTLKPDGTWSYKPYPGIYDGNDSFIFTVTDTGDGADTRRLTDTGTIIIAINPVNEPPIANDDADKTMNEDTSLTIYDLLYNDTDPDIAFKGDEIKITAVTGNKNGTVVISDDGKSITYTPNADWNGTEILTYTIADKAGVTDTATVKIVVYPVNDAPIAEDDTVSTNEDKTATINVLANDTDIDGDTLIILNVQQGENGKTTIKDGKVIYTPNANYHGTDTLDWQRV